MNNELNIVPSIKLSVKQTFGIDSNLEVDAFEKKNEFVPEIDKNYKFDRDTTIAILSGFSFNKRVLVQGYHGTGKSTHIEQIAARLNWPCIRVNLDSHISRIDLIGKDAIVLKEGKQITEFKEESKRMEKLDEQFEDLNRALETLTSAIKQIDDESKSRFSETFEKVNEGLSKHFPRLFDGGKAYLELEDNDALNGGVFVMARPPGKRNSNIHLLSGGEKALTAVALLFSIFELNPAPFCLLDEVDAPLDDTNVARFCEIVKEMSSNVQFVVITHNKTTMELTKQLIGVTMSEPGVSRLVSVDLDEAIELSETPEAS